MITQISALKLHAKNFRNVHKELCINICSFYVNIPNIFRAPYSIFNMKSSSNELTWTKSSINDENKTKFILVKKICNLYLSFFNTTLNTVFVDSACHQICLAPSGLKQIAPSCLKKIPASCHTCSQIFSMSDVKYIK